jgi:hypothetical protein
MIYLSVDREMAFQPCAEYTRERVEKLFAGRKQLHFRTVAQLDIPPEDRVWTLLHMMSERQQHEAACRFAEQAFAALRQTGQEPHPDSLNAIAVKRRWLCGDATDDEMAAARDAAWDAAWDAGAAARDAASRDAARDAAWAAARAAARDAARDAARAAAWGAAWDAAWDEQIEIACSILAEKGKA